MLHITTDDINKNITATDALENMQDLFHNHMNGSEKMQRQICKLDDDLGLTLFMPACNNNKKILGIKVSSIRPKNTAHKIVNGVYILIDYATGLHLATIESNSITELRTAAVSAMVTKHVVANTAHSLGIIGAGVQSFAHIEALCKSIAINKITIYSRTYSKSIQLINKIQQYPWSPQQILAVQSIYDVINDSSILCTCTSTASTTPLFKAEELPINVKHINAIGGATQEAIEIDPILYAKSLTIVEDIASAAQDSNEISIALNEKYINTNSIHTVANILSNQNFSSSINPHTLSIYRSVGMAEEDLFLAWYIYEKMRKI